MEKTSLLTDRTDGGMQPETSVCVIQTRTGQEEAVINFMDKLVDPWLIKDRFIPVRVMPRRENGMWNKRSEKLFPGYVFIETPDMQKLFMQLKKIPRLTKLLSYGKYNFYALNKKEISYINRISPAENGHVFGMSRAMIDEMNDSLKPGDRVVIISGGLLNLKGDITRFDIHHRRAYIKTGLFDGAEICVGIELIDRL